MNHVVNLPVIKLRSSVDFMVGIFSTKGYEIATHPPEQAYIYPIIISTSHRI